MKKNQNGFSVVETLIVIVVVGLLGVIGWLVYDRQNNKVNTKQSSDNKTEQQGTDNRYTTYSHNSDGYSFQYPKDWKIEQSTEGPSTLVTSPDFKSSDSTGDNGSFNGGRFILSKSSIVEGSPKLDDILSNKSGVDVDAKRITVDGKEAVRFKRTYPSVSIKTYVYTADSIYEQAYFGPGSTDYEKYLADYDNLVNTFKIK